MSLINSSRCLLVDFVFSRLERTSGLCAFLLANLSKIANGGLIGPEARREAIRSFQFIPSYSKIEVVTPLNFIENAKGCYLTWLSASNKECRQKLHFAILVGRPYTRALIAKT